MLKKVKIENLPVYMAKIDAIFPEFQAKAQISVDQVDAYYRESFWGYALFHSWSGAIHMALSEGGEFSKNDYFRQAEEVEQVLLQSTSKVVRVLEVGCGRGFNIAYLASRFPHIEFVGVDINQDNIRSAHRMLAALSNASVHVGDFHKLGQFEDSFFDLILAVETLCHSNEMDKALASVGRVLSAGGKLIVYDGFRNADAAKTDLVERALSYTERAMAVPEFRTVDNFVSDARGARLVLDQQENRSSEIMPNLIRLSDLAKAFFKIKPVSKIVLTTLPRGLVTNAVAGLLMAVTVQMGAHQYFKLVFRKLA